MPENLAELILTVDDFNPPHCPAGLRYWWRLQGFDFADFLKNGISAETIWMTGDTQAQAVVIRKLESIRGE